MLKGYQDGPGFAEATGTATAAIALAAQAKKRHFVSGINASFSVTAVDTVRLRSGTTQVASFSVHNQRDIVFDPPLRFPDETAVNATLDLGASGTLSRLIVQHVTV